MAEKTLTKPRGGKRQGAGRKPGSKFSKQQVSDAILKHFGYVYLIAKDLECTPKTVYNAIERYKLDDVVKDCNEFLLDLAEVKLQELIRRGNLGAICFFLKTRGKERGYVERTETTGVNGAPIEVNVDYKAIFISRINSASARLREGNSPAGSLEPTSAESSVRLVTMGTSEPTSTSG